MENIHIALFACSNGYGHIKRLLLLSQALSLTGANPVLFAPKMSTELIAKKEGITTYSVNDFNTNTSKENWQDGSAINWIKFVPNLSKFDVVICDNMIEILLIRPDAWISGSFFWHDAFNNFPVHLKKKSLELLKQYKPRMISSELFSSDQLHLHTELYEVGLYSGYSLDNHFSKKTDALIACGIGGSVKTHARDFVSNLVNKGATKFNKVWVDPSILPSNYPSWMSPASFSKEMYQKTLVSIIRPGVGSITNSLSVGARVFPFYESDNLEMTFNVSRLNSFGLANETSLIAEAWKQAEIYADNKDLQEAHKNKLKDLKFDGANQAAKIILSKL